MIRHSLATFDTNERRQRYATAFPMWRMSKSRARCPRQVAGKRCLWMLDRPGADPSCLCETWIWRKILDHGRLWINEVGRHVLTGEPYELHSGVLSEISEEAEALGLEVWMHGYSPHAPGEAMLFVFQQKGAAPLQLRGRTYLPDYSFQGA